MNQIKAQNKSICLQYISSDGRANAQRHIPLNIYFLFVTMVIDTASTTRVGAEIGIIELNGSTTFKFNANLWQMPWLHILKQILRSK